MQGLHPTPQSDEELVSWSTAAWTPSTSSHLTTSHSHHPLPGGGEGGRQVTVVSGRRVGGEVGRRKGERMSAWVRTWTWGFVGPSMYTRVPEHWRVR